MKVTEEVEYLVRSGPEYQAYYPRFLVDVSRDKKVGTVEVTGMREELEAMTVIQVRERALQKAIAGDWLNKPD